MDRFRLPNTVDYHLPSVLLGKILPSWNKEKGKFDVIKDDIELYFSDSIDLKKLMKVVDDVDQTEAMGFTQSMKLLAHVMSHLRIKLLSRDVMVIERAAVLLDFLVKNCHYRIHIYISRKMFMKTFCLVLRQLLADDRPKHKATGTRMLDILQGWGEAFKIHRREIYPYVIASYEKTRHKYGIKYPRSDFDPTRVPIFLEPINRHEINEAIKSKSRLGIFTSQNSSDSPRGNNEESKIGSTYSFDSVSSSIVSDKDSDLDSDMISFNDNDRMISSQSSVQNMTISTPTVNDMPISIPVEKSLKTTKNTPQLIESNNIKVERELIEFDKPIYSVGYLDLNDTTQNTDVLQSEHPSIPLKKNIPTNDIPKKNVPDTSESWLVDFSDTDLLIMPKNNNSTQSTPTIDTPISIINTNNDFHTGNISPIPPISSTTFLTVKTTDITQASDPHSKLIGSILASYSAPINSDENILTPSSTSQQKNTSQTSTQIQSQQTQQKVNHTVLTAQYGINNGDTTPVYGNITRGIIKPKEVDNGDKLLNLLNLDVKQMLSTMKEKGPEIKSARSVPPTPAPSTPFCPPPTPTPYTPIHLIKLSETNKNKPNAPIIPTINTPVEPPLPIIKKQEIMKKQVVYETATINTNTNNSNQNQNPNKIPEQIIAEKPTTKIIEPIPIQPKIVAAEKVEKRKEIEINSIQSKPEEKIEKIVIDKIPFPLSSPPLSICTSHNKEYGNKMSKLLEENECIDTPQTVDLLFAQDSRKLKHVEPIQNLTHESLRTDSCDSADHHGQLTDIDQRRRLRSNSYAPPSSDSTVEVRYFGHQRVVIKKK